METVLAAVTNAQGLAGSASGSHPRLINAWTSRTAHLYRVRIDSNDANDVVVKVFKNTAQAAELAPALDELAVVMSADQSDRFHPVRTLGFSGAFGSVVMPYVAGPSLEQMLRAQSDPACGRNALQRLLEGCGRLLAKYHARYADDSRDRADEAWRDLDNRFATLFGAARLPRELVKPSVVTRNFGDFHAGHFIVSDQQRLAVVDPAIEWHYSFGGRDMACFIDRLLMTLLHPSTRWKSRFRAASYGELSAAFVRGYDDARAVAPTNGDRVALDIYRAFRLKRRLLKFWRQRPSRFLYYGVPLLYQYRRLISRLRTVPGLVSAAS